MLEVEMPLHENFTANLKKRRQDLGLTQAQLAEKLGVSRPYICQVERGDHSPTLDAVERFAEALNCASAIELLLSADPVRGPHSARNKKVNATA